MMQRGLRAVICAVLVVGMAALAHAQAPAQTPAPASGPAGVTAAVDQLSWIAGPWRGVLNDRTIEQHWMTPVGGSLVGMYRSIRENRVTLYEILAIEQQGDHVFLRIKHFAPGAGLVSQEAKDQSADHVLVKLEERTAVFEGVAGGNRVTFNSPDQDTLNITVERQREGKPVATEFKYKRIR